MFFISKYLCHPIYDQIYYVIEQGSARDFMSLFLCQKKEGRRRVTRTGDSPIRLIALDLSLIHI